MFPPRLLNILSLYRARDLRQGETMSTQTLTFTINLMKDNSLVRLLLPQRLALERLKETSIDRKAPTTLQLLRAALQIRPGSFNKNRPQIIAVAGRALSTSDSSKHSNYSAKSGRRFSSTCTPELPPKRDHTPRKSLSN